MRFTRSGVSFRVTSKGRVQVLDLYGRWRIWRGQQLELFPWLRGPLDVFEP